MQVQWPTPLNHPLMIKQKVTGKGLELKNIRMTGNNQRLGGCMRATTIEGPNAFAPFMVCFA